MQKLSIVIPCYQSEHDFDRLIAELSLVLPIIQTQIAVTFVLVDDGSTDGTWEAMQRFKAEFPNTKLLKLTGNFGSHAAFLAGLTHSDGDCFSILHPDLQDPPEHLPLMVDYWLRGWKLVIGQRTRREDGFWKNSQAGVFHWLIKKIALPHIPEGGYDLVLFDKEIRNKVVELQEPNNSLIYLISSFKHPYITIPITRKANPRGVSAWTPQKGIKLIFDSIVGFSYFPIQLVSLLALLLGLLFLVLLGVWCYSLAVGSAISLFFKVFLVLSGFSCLLSLMLAIIAEYLWRTLEAVRKRPAFVVEKLIN
jgi:dolichol-phosphate mannosyltransferase